MNEKIFPFNLELNECYANVFAKNYSTEYAEHHIETVGHRHGFYSIELITEGDASQYINEEKYAFPCGSIVLMSPFDSHRYSYSGVLKLEYLCFSEENLFSEVWENVNIDHFPYIAYLNEDELKSIQRDIDTIKEETNRKDDFSKSVIKGLLNKIVIQILRGAHKKTQKKKHKDIKSVLSYIRYHFREQITMEQMADMLHITPSYFCRCFKEYTDQTFKEYIMSLRLDYALRQINTTDKSITEICYESGFSSSAYFSKVFTQKFGTPPSKIRKNI